MGRTDAYSTVSAEAFGRLVVATSRVTGGRRGGERTFRRASPRGRELAEAQPFAKS